MFLRWRTMYKNIEKNRTLKLKYFVFGFFSSLNNILWLKNNMFKISRHILWIICWQSSTRNNIKTKMVSLKTSLGPSTFQFIQQMRYLFINSFVDIFILKNGNYSILSVKLYHDKLSLFRPRQYKETFFWSAYF